MSWHRMRRGVGGEPDPIEYKEKQAQLSELQRLEDIGEIDLYYLDETGFFLIPSALMFGKISVNIYRSRVGQVIV